MTDLLGSFEYSQFNVATEEIEGKLNELIACRHEYPMWPTHGDPPFDIYEEMLHTPIRHTYYRTTLCVLQVVRALRKLA